VDDSGKVPCVLIVATGRWVSTARLGMALAGLGCRVELVGTRNHPAHSTGAFSSSYRYDPLRPLESLRRALREANPDGIIPADELALMHLDELARSSAPGDALAKLLARSIGDALVFSAAQSRMELLRLAKGEGVAVPETVEVRNPRELGAAIERIGLPLVLKADSTSGGRGVRIATSASEAMRAWKMLQQPPGLARVFKRGAIEKDWTHLRTWTQRTLRDVTAQRFIPFAQGAERTGMAMCRHGKVMAFACLEVLETWCERGPSSLVRVVEDAVMERAMRLVAGRLGVSGFCGFDFIVDPGTGTPLLIEMNPRPTQLTHLPLGPGRDLAASYVREILGLSEVRDRQSATALELIAVFPQELQRDPAGASLTDAFHDVPWDSPELMRQVLGRVPQLLTADARWHGGKK
jgi:hypothetical protein